MAVRSMFGGGVSAAALAALACIACCAPLVAPLLIGFAAGSAGYAIFGLFGVFLAAAIGLWLYLRRRAAIRTCGCGTAGCVASGKMPDNGGGCR